MVSRSVVRLRRICRRLGVIMLLLVSVLYFYDDLRAVEDIDQWPIVFKPQNSKPLNISPITRAGEVSLMSAFRDPRFPDAILVLSIGHLKAMQSAQTCYLWRGGKLVGKSAVLKTKWIGKEESGYFGHIVFCEVNDVRAEITSVGLSATSSIAVVDIPREEPSAITLAACVGPMYASKYSEAHLVAWIELQRQLGVSHFLFYNYSLHSSLDRLFRFYVHLGVVSLRQWNVSHFPVDKMGNWPPTNDRLYYFGQVEANNECLFLLSHRFRYLMFVDVDEVILPYKDGSLKGFLRRVDPISWLVVSFQFGRSRVLTQSPVEVKTMNHELVLKEKVVFFMKTSTSGFVPYPGKQIVRASKAIRVHVHETMEYSSVFSMTWRVASRTAKVLHHADPRSEHQRQQESGAINFQHEPRMVKLLRLSANATVTVLRMIRRSSS